MRTFIRQCRYVIATAEGAPGDVEEVLEERIERMHEFCHAMIEMEQQRATRFQRWLDDSNMACEDPDVIDCVRGNENIFSVRDALCQYFLCPAVVGADEE